MTPCSFHSASGWTLSESTAHGLQPVAVHQPALLSIRNITEKDTVDYPFFPKKRKKSKFNRMISQVIGESAHFGRINAMTVPLPLRRGDSLEKWINDP